MITVCIPVLNRYDLIGDCIDSASKGSVKADRILVVDNGGRLSEFYPHLKEGWPEVRVYLPGRNIGVAAAWNYFIKNTKEHRIIVNDDIIFCEDTLEKMAEKLDEGNEFCWTCRPFGVLNGFSCFALLDSLIAKIGYFDEEISPNYAYFEDNDFARRMLLAGVSPVESGAEAVHKTSSTLHAFTPQQAREHGARFELAKSNYIKKWGGLPHQETYSTPYNQ